MSMMERRWEHDITFSDSNGQKDGGWGGTVIYKAFEDGCLFLQAYLLMQVVVLKLLDL